MHTTPSGRDGAAPGQSDGAAPGSSDPRLSWSDTDGAAGPPPLLHRRDGILPTVAAALSVRGDTLTSTASKGDQPPPLHPLVQDFLDTLTSAQRERFTGRCPDCLYNFNVGVLRARRP